MCKEDSSVSNILKSEEILIDIHFRCDIKTEQVLEQFGMLRFRKRRNQMMNNCPFCGKFAKKGLEFCKKHTAVCSHCKKEISLADEFEVCADCKKLAKKCEKCNMLLPRGLQQKYCDDCWPKCKNCNSKLMHDPNASLCDECWPKCTGCDTKISPDSDKSVCEKCEEKYCTECGAEIDLNDSAHEAFSSDAFLMTDEEASKHCGSCLRSYMRNHEDGSFGMDACDVSDNIWGGDDEYDDEY